MTNYTAFLKTRAAASRAIGRCIVERIEAGQAIADLVSESGAVKGLDIVPAVAVEMSGVSRARRHAAHAVLRA
jgi:hypothetical protein